MAIQFARCQFVSRSSGGNACRKAAYNQRESIPCDRTGELFSFKSRGGNIHHEILLPAGVNEKFKNSTILWNTVEHAERRKNSQVAKEFVLALPDNREVTGEDRLELTRRFAQESFIDRGVAVQLDIHAPHEREKNWHAHLLVTTRRFSDDGESLSLKARDLNPLMRGGLVIEGELWGETWRDIQNTYFEEKGYDIRVDPIGIIPGEHLGPVRMRNLMNDALVRAELLQKANDELSLHPQFILNALTKNRPVFTEQDIQTFLTKHIPMDEREALFEKIRSHPSVIELFDKDTSKKTNLFTTKDVRLEEEKLLRFTDQIAKKKIAPISLYYQEQSLQGKSLTEEQKNAFELCTQSKENLCIIQGRAGVGKSHVLKAIREAHELRETRVIGLAPTHKVVQEMVKSGFKEASTCHAFLFAFKNNREQIDRNTLLVVDEASMLSNTLSIELFNIVRQRGAKLILVGDDRQLRSIKRGGLFGLLAERYASVELKNVMRQTIDWQKSVSECLSRGDIKTAIQHLEENKAIKWKDSREESLATLLKDWAKSRDLNPKGSHQILAQRNVDVDALNQGAREILKSKRKLGNIEITCMTQRGISSFAEGDRIQFTKTDSEQGLINGSFGYIEHVHPETKMMTVCLDNHEYKKVDPHTYNGLRHGYASTVYKAQGATLAHIHVLHDESTNKSTSYVALSRQTNTLSLYVSKKETPTLNHLSRQMSRDFGESTSLYYDTQKDIELRKLNKSLRSIFIQQIENVFTYVKDLFHKNENFYRYDRHKELNKDEPFVTRHDDKTSIDFEYLKQVCSNKLYDSLNNKGNITPEVKNHINRQSRKAASFLIHNCDFQNNLLTEVEIKESLRRAKYEEDRVQEIYKEMMGVNSLSFKLKDELEIFRIAERRASIEGRILQEVFQDKREMPQNLASYANIEVKENMRKQKALKAELEKSNNLSDEVASYSSLFSVYHKETHGKEPTTGQMKMMIRVSQELVNRKQALKLEHCDSRTIDYRLIKEGEQLVNIYSVSAKSLSFKELQKIQEYSQSSLDLTKQNIAHTKSAFELEKEKSIQIGKKHDLEI
jgi:Ti-type conjugative transfer relaxase TraA